MDSDDRIQQSTRKERVLSDSEKLRLSAQDKKLVTEFKRNKLDHESQKMWDLFYKRNKTNFFKDRHWTSREFEELIQLASFKENPVMLEAGCGVGNFLFPLLDQIDNLYIYACDFSPRAVDFVRANEKFSPERCNVFHCDLTTPNCFESQVPSHSVDALSLIFVLSAISPEKFPDVLENCYSVLAPGGCILFRDYGINDHAMIRFGPGNKISENFYVRQDGTRAYYFTIEMMTKLVQSVGLEVTSNEYILRETRNLKEGLSVPRVFLQGKFRKPSH